MISKKVTAIVNSPSNGVIRKMFEEGAQLKKKFGAENVYDFKHECSANLKLLVMKVVSLFTISVVSANKGRHRSNWLV